HHLLRHRHHEWIAIGDEDGSFVFGHPPRHLPEHVHGGDGRDLVHRVESGTVENWPAHLGGAADRFFDRLQPRDAADLDVHSAACAPHEIDDQGSEGERGDELGESRGVQPGGERNHLEPLRRSTVSPLAMSPAPRSTKSIPGKTTTFFPIWIRGAMRAPFPTSVMPESRCVGNRSLLRFSPSTPTRASFSTATSLSRITFSRIAPDSIRQSFIRMEERTSAPASTITPGERIERD